MKSIDLAQQLTALESNMDTAITTVCESLLEQGKGYIDDNDAYGKVSVVDFNKENRIWLAQYKWAIGVATKGKSLFVHLLNTDTGDRIFGAADYLLPFEETRELTPYKLIKVLEVLEKMQ